MIQPRSRGTSARLGVCALAFAVHLLTPVDVAAAGRPVTLTAADGTALTGLFYEASPRPAPGVVLVHMLGRSKDEWAPFADRLQSAGVNVLAVDLRGHGGSGGNGAALALMVGDVRAAAEWLATRPTTRPNSVALVGASLGANLAALAAGDVVAVRAVALLSPSLDYRGVRLDAGTIKKLAGRGVWLLASAEDPFALRTVHELAGVGGAIEQRLSSVRGHGTVLLSSDPELAPALLDWLRRSLIF